MPMTSFFDKLNGKLKEGRSDIFAARPTAASDPAAGKTADKPSGQNPPPKESAEVAPPDAQNNDQPFPIDLFQSESRVIVFAQAPGISPEDFDIVLDEETNTLLIKGMPRRPDAKLPSEEKEEKGKFLKQECKWDAMYRKVYLPGGVDASAAEAIFKKGVLMVFLPMRKAGEGKKLKVEETLASPQKQEKAAQ